MQTSEQVWLAMRSNWKPHTPQSRTRFNSEPPRGPAIPLPGTIRRSTENIPPTNLYRNARSNMIQNSPTWKQPMCPSTDQHKWPIHTVAARERSAGQIAPQAEGNLKRARRRGPDTKGYILHVSIRHIQTRQTHKDKNPNTPTQNVATGGWKVGGTQCDGQRVEAVLHG